MVDAIFVFCFYFQIGITLAGLLAGALFAIWKKKPWVIVPLGGIVAFIWPYSLYSFLIKEKVSCLSKE